MKDQSAPLELLPFVEAKNGQMLVERFDMPKQRGQILLPFSVRDNHRAAEAVVRDSQIPRYETGDIVVLTDRVTRTVNYGEGSDQVSLWIASSTSVLFELAEALTVEVGQDHFAKNITAEQYEEGNLDGSDEGEPSREAG